MKHSEQKLVDGGGNISEGKILFDNEIFMNKKIWKRHDDEQKSKTSKVK